MKKQITLKKLFINLTISVLSLIVFFSLAELLTRIFWHHNVTQDNVGIRLEGSNRSAVIGGIEYRLNSLGLRMNNEINPEKPKGIMRILALGDSFLFGDGLPYGELITGKIEKALNTNNQKVEVINAGHGGFNTNDELIQLKKISPMCQPDLVIVFFFTNDVIKYSLDLSKASWRQKAKEYLRIKSKFFAFLYYIYKDRLASKIGVPKALLASEYFNLDDSKPGWVEFKKAVLQINELCKINSAKLLFVLIPTLTNLDNKYPYAELRTAVTRFLSLVGIYQFDLFDVFSPYKPSDLWVSLENPHWNGFATSLAAKKIIEYIIDQRLIRYQL